MTDGTSQGLFVIVAVVIFGIFVGISYLLFKDTLKTKLTSIFTDSLTQAEKALGNTVDTDEKEDNTLQEYVDLNLSKSEYETDLDLVLKQEVFEKMENNKKYKIKIDDSLKVKNEIIDLLDVSKQFEIESFNTDTQQKDYVIATLKLSSDLKYILIETNDLLENYLEQAQQYFYSLPRFFENTDVKEEVEDEEDGLNDEKGAINMDFSVLSSDNLLAMTYTSSESIFGLGVSVMERLVSEYFVNENTKYLLKTPKNYPFLKEIIDGEISIDTDVIYLGKKVFTIALSNDKQHLFMRGYDGLHEYIQASGGTYLHIDEVYLNTYSG